MGSAFNRSLQNYINLKVSLDLMKRMISHRFRAFLTLTTPQKFNTDFNYTYLPNPISCLGALAFISLRLGSSLLLETIPYEDEKMLENQSLQIYSLSCVCSGSKMSFKLPCFLLDCRALNKKVSPDSIPNHPPKNFGAHLRSS